MDMRVVIGANVKKFRALRGIKTQDELADKVKALGGKVGKDAIKKIEQGQENPTYETLACIAKALDMEFEELFIEDSRLLHIRIMLSDHNMKTLESVKDFIDKALEAKKKQAGS